jgi:OOP family OmpA-OmpF porin
VQNKHSARITFVIMSLSLVLMLGTLLPGSGFGQTPPGEKRTIADATEATIKGAILSRDGETFVLRDISRADTVVVLTDSTKIRTERKGLFRGKKAFDVTALIVGLIVEAKGKGDSKGRLVAEDIQFSEADLKAAITASVRTAPVEKKSDEALKGVADADKRISSLDQYDVVKTVTVLFDVNKYALKPEAKKQLDELASKAPSAKNYAVEVKGYTDPTGDFDKNLELSQRRAETVVQYLTVKHNIPLRRIMIPMGYGETKPVSGGKTAAERAQDRRVEVSVLVNKGLNQ